jgi:hypothetical protein
MGAAELGGMIDPAKAALFIPPTLSPFKRKLFLGIGRRVGRVIDGDFKALGSLPDTIVPIVGCTPELRPLIDDWTKRNRTWVYWDRGYCDRVFATCLPEGDNGGMYRWHVGSFQMKSIRLCPDDRWRGLKAAKTVQPWRKNGRHIVIAAPTITYGRFHRTESWIAETIRALALVTDRQLVIRDKEQYKRRPRQMDIEGAHCLVTHGSNAAVEAAILGCPVFVDKSSAAALVGKTDVKEIERPSYPDREPWLRSLAYSQFTEHELTDGTLWKYLQ